MDMPLHGWVFRDPKLPKAEGRVMKAITTIVTFVILALRAWGQQTCSAPTPVFNPPTILSGETQPLELHGFVRTALTVSSFAMGSSIYGASGFPWMDCREQVFTRITESNTFLTISPPTGGDYLIYETGLTSKQAPTLVGKWSMQDRKSTRLNSSHRCIS